MPAKIFCCYAHEDEAMLNQLKIHLTPLQQEGLIDTWHDCDISAKTGRESEVDEHLEAAQIILLLISPEFITSAYCDGIEINQAIERHYQEEATVIPLILRSTSWEEALGTLQVLPRNAEPVMSSRWHSEAEAFLEVTEGIRETLGEIVSKYSIIENPVSSQFPSASYTMRSDRQATIHQLLCQLVDERPELERDICSEITVRFGVKSWDIPVLKEGKKWPPSGRILLFTIEDKRQSLDFQLGLGWSPEGTDIREKLFRMALSNEPPFRPIHFQQLPAKWVYLYRRKMLHPRAYSELNDEALKVELRKEWADFIEHVLPQLDAVLKKQEWLR